MKSIIVDMGEMRDSVEFYKSRPNRFLIFTIYFLFAILVIALVWMSVFRMDDIVKSDGMFRSSDDVLDISSAVTGRVSEVNVRNGDYVNEGDTLYVVSIDSLSETINSYQTTYDEANARIEMLNAYEDSLNTGNPISESFNNNIYYSEFVSKRDLLITTIASEISGTNSQSSVYGNSLNDANAMIATYQNSINSLEQVKVCVMNRTNTFPQTDSYYYSMVDSYIASYNSTVSQYDARVAELQAQINSLNQQINSATDQATRNDLTNQRNTAQASITSTNSEKASQLSSLESNQISNVESLIQQAQSNLAQYQSSANSALVNLSSVTDPAYTRDIRVLTEKGNIASERITYEQRRAEAENYLNSYNIQEGNCIIKAAKSGYYYAAAEIKAGAYLQEGGSVGSIYPNDDTGFYAQLYVENKDIGNISEGDTVRFDIAAYPASEYGFFTGVVEDISKDVTVSEETEGQAYYIVRVSCDTTSITGKNSETVSLKNGMACQGKIIIGDMTVLNYVLEKINLID